MVEATSAKITDQTDFFGYLLKQESNAAEFRTDLRHIKDGITVIQRDFKDVTGLVSDLRAEQRLAGQAIGELKNQDQRHDAAIRELSSKLEALETRQQKMEARMARWAGILTGIQAIIGIAMAVAEFVI